MMISSSSGYPLPAYSDSGKWRVNIAGFPVIEENTEASARAKMLIYLLEKKLIKK